MCRYTFVIFITIYFAIVESSCPTPQQFYIDCRSTQTLGYALLTCSRYGMTLLDLTNATIPGPYVNHLNDSLHSNNCISNFWFSFGNRTGLVANVNTLATVLGGLLGGLLGGVVDILLCLLGGCPITTTPTPTTHAIIICTRPFQQGVIQKCQTPSIRTDMKTFKFHEEPMYGGILDSFPSRSRTTCSGICSSNDQCIGISYINGICNLHI